MKNLHGKLTYANVISTVALFLVLAGGTAFAADEALLPRDSVGTMQLKPASVTPKKLSRAAKRSLRGAAGPVGPKGDRGESGAAGLQGQSGSGGGFEPLVVDATGEVADVRTSSEITLDGTTSWTSTSAQIGLLTGDFTATMAKEPGGYACFTRVVVFDDGTEAGEFSAYTGEESFGQFTARLGAIPIALHEPGNHTITAKSFGSAECAPGSKIDSIHLVVTPLGG